MREVNVTFLLEVLSLKKINRIICSLLALTCILTAFCPMAFASANDNKTTDNDIIVEVMLPDYDEEEIANTELDDGTLIGDYNYTITYTPKLTRDPIYWSAYFDQAMWITRDGKVSLSLKPKSNVRNSKSVKDQAWTIISGTYTGFGNHANWPKESQKVKTFKWQYDCHYYFANGKDTWNIEPWRSASTYAAVVVKKCNP